MKSKLAISIVLLFFVNFTHAQNNKSSVVASWQVQSYRIFENENSVVAAKKTSREIETLIQQKAIFTFTKENKFSKPDNSSTEYTYSVIDNHITIYNEHNEIDEQLDFTIIENKLILKYKLSGLNEYIEITAIKI